MQQRAEVASRLSDLIATAASYFEVAAVVGANPGRLAKLRRHVDDIAATIERLERIPDSESVYRELIPIEVLKRGIEDWPGGTDVANRIRENLRMIDEGRLNEPQLMAESQKFDALAESFQDLATSQQRFAARNVPIDW